MRQPFCGWLLTAVVVSTAPTAQASTPESARQPSNGIPCAAAGNLRPSVDITCCHGPDFKPAHPTAPQSMPVSSSLQPATSRVAMGGEVK